MMIDENLKLSINTGRLVKGPYLVSNTFSGKFLSLLVLRNIFGLYNNDASQHNLGTCTHCFLILGSLVAKGV